MSTSKNKKEQRKIRLKIEMESIATNSTNLKKDLGNIEYLPGKKLKNNPGGRKLIKDYIKYNKSMYN